MIDDLKMPMPDSEEVDLGLDEIELPGEAEDAEIQEMISKLEDRGYKVEKIDSEMPEPSADEMDLEDDLEL